MASSGETECGHCRSGGSDIGTASARDVEEGTTETETRDGSLGWAPGQGLVALDSGRVRYRNRGTGGKKVRQAALFGMTYAQPDSIQPYYVFAVLYY